MIYLMESGKYYKIGYTKDISKRIKVYQTYNPECILVQVKEGTYEDEAILQNLCKAYLFKNEWFHKDSEVLKLFTEYVQKSTPPSSKVLFRRKACKDYYNSRANKTRRVLKQYDKNGNKIAEWNSQREAQKALGIDNTLISKCIKGEIKFAGGYKWSY